MDDAPGSVTSDDSDPELAEKPRDPGPITTPYSPSESQYTTAEWVYAVLCDPVQGCSESEHEQMLQAHDKDAEGRHYSLAATYTLTETGRAPWPKVREYGLGGRAIPLPRLRNHPREDYPGADALLEIVQGKEAGQDLAPVKRQARKHVCLHAEHVDGLPVVSSWDVDSFIMKSYTLAVLQGLKYKPEYQPRSDISATLHVPHSFTFSDRAGRVRSRTTELCNIPQLYIGRVVGWSEATVHLVFPQMYSEDEERPDYDAKRLHRFIDWVMLPAIRRSVSGSKWQHFPQSSQLATLKSMARIREAKTAAGARRGAIDTSYALDGVELVGVWAAIEERCAAEPDLSCFRDAFVVVNAKNTKLRFRSTISLAHTIHDFVRRTRQLFRDEVVCDAETFLDLGVEVVPKLDEGDEKHVLLLRRCCIRRFVQDVAQRFFGPSQGVVNLYHPGFLRDTATFTVEPPKRSRLWTDGVRYLQGYFSGKEIVDAQKLYPFDDHKLSELTVDPQVHASAAAEMHGSHVHRRADLVHGYNGTKTRVWEALTGAEDTAYGFRFELRTSLRLAETVAAIAASRSRAPSPAAVNSPRASNTWAIPTRTYVGFLLGNYDKFTSIFEIMHLTTPPTGVSIPRTQLQLPLLQCLRILARGDLHTYRGLAIATRDGERGLGMGDNLERYGYAWWDSVVDWAALTVKSRLQEHMNAFTSHPMKWYQPAEQGMRDAREVREQCRDLLRAYPSERVQQEIKQLLAHVVFARYRKDVWDSLCEDAADREPEREEHDRWTLRWARQTFGPHWALVTGNRGQIKTWHDFCAFIFDHAIQANGSGRRKVCANKPYWILHEEVRRLLQVAGLARDWIEFRDAEFRRYFWIVPYPEMYMGCLVNKTKKGQVRQWWHPREEASLNAARDEQSPPEYPRTLWMTRDELGTHIASLYTPARVKAERVSIMAPFARA